MGFNGEKFWIIFYFHLALFFHHVLSQICLPYSITTFPVTAPFTNCKESAQLGLLSQHPDQNKNTEEILKTYGYPYQVYNVTTQDNYILTVYRIIGSPHLNREMWASKKYPVYLQHGIAQASDGWNFQPGNRNLPFKLADAGFEIWMGNSRGTTYSRGHTRYNAETDLDYWDFSFHEMGIYDVPATTNLILEVTLAEKLFYIGHSLGTTQLLIALSEYPEMNDKIHAAFLLAPLAYIGHSYHLSRLFAPVASSYTLYTSINMALRGRVGLLQPELMRLGIPVDNYCSATAVHCAVCQIAIFGINGYNAPQMNASEIPNIVAKSGNSASLKTYAHYAQLMRSCTFQQFNYGLVLNLEKYGSPYPPEYNLENVRAPLYLYHGERDNFATPSDVNLTASRLRPGVLRRVDKVQDELFNHADFITAKDADILLYNSILAEMEKLEE